MVMVQSFSFVEVELAYETIPRKIWINLSLVTQFKIKEDTTDVQFEETVVIIKGNLMDKIKH